MSCGNPIIPVRFSHEMLAKIEAAIIYRNDYCRGQPFTLSDWIRKACQEKLDHLARGIKLARVRRANKEGDRENV